jgi:hypothetical protein
MEEKKETIWQRRKKKITRQGELARRAYKQKVKVVYNTKGKILKYNREPPKEDYLKYYRIVRYWACKYYQVSMPNLEVILFLHSEGLFTENDFNEFASLCGFTVGKFEALVKDGFIVIFKQATNKEVAMFELSRKARTMVTKIYAKLNGLEPISERGGSNKLFLASAGWAEKQYAKAIINMNKKTAKERIPGYFKDSVNSLKILRNGMTVDEFIESKRNPSQE